MNCCLDSCHKFKWGRQFALVALLILQFYRPIEKRERDLERTGPKYNHPGVVQILHNLPFLRHVPHRIVEVRTVLQPLKQRLVIWRQSLRRVNVVLSLSDMEVGWHDDLKALEM